MVVAVHYKQDPSQREIVALAPFPGNNALEDFQQRLQGLELFADKLPVGIKAGLSL